VKGGSGGGEGVGGGDEWVDVRGRRDGGGGGWWEGWWVRGGTGERRGRGDGGGVGWVRRIGGGVGLGVERGGGVGGGFLREGGRMGGKGKKADRWVWSGNLVEGRANVPWEETHIKPPGIAGKKKKRNSRGIHNAKRSAERREHKDPQDERGAAKFSFWVTPGKAVRGRVTGLGTPDHHYSLLKKCWT